jgi:hypothetical protein
MNKLKVKQGRAKWDKEHSPDPAIAEIVQILDRLDEELKELLKLLEE